MPYARTYVCGKAEAQQDSPLYQPNFSKTPWDPGFPKLSQWTHGSYRAGGSCARIQPLPTAGELDEDPVEWGVGARIG